MWRVIFGVLAAAVFVVVADHVFEDGGEEIETSSKYLFKIELTISECIYKLAGCDISLRLVVHGSFE